jgi:hypothetical protein
MIQAGVDFILVSEISRIERASVTQLISQSLQINLGAAGQRNTRTGPMKHPSDGAA